MNAFAQNCAITGAANVCPSDIKIYSINLTGCNGTPTGYLWSVTGNGSISGANNNATVSISWGAAGSGSVSVVVTTSSGSFNPLPLNVSISSLPAPIVTTDVDLECTVYIDGEHNGDPTIAPEECFQVCEYSTAHYQTPLNAGSTYSWVVNGALSHSAAQNQLTVLWGTYGTGTVEITETNSSGCSTTISYCITKVQKPGVLFSTIPLSNINYGTPLQICLGQTIYFFDESVTSAYGSPIVSWFWDFGDGNTSILQNPEHIYQNAQDYDVTLTVTNACNCTNTISLHVIVDPQQWVDIECATPVCEGSTDTYFTNANCTQYNWIVTNGTIISPQPYGNNIQVLWGSGQNGPGVVSLSAVGCANNCPAMSSIVVPIFSNSVTISGTNPACTSQQTAYSVPMVPGSFYNWSVTPSGTIVSGQGTNQVIIDWGGYVGQANVHCDYQNIFLHCPEGATDLTVDVREEFTVTGPSDICQNLLAPITYTAQSNVGAAVFRFKIKNAAGSYVYNQPGPFSTSVTFNSWNWGAGIFTLEVYNYQGYFCNSPQTMQIKVNASPAAPAAPTGDDEVCPSLPYLYSAPTLSSSTFEYVWNIIGGNTDAPNGTLTTAFGNSITVYWKSPYVPNSKVQLAILDKETGCQSLYTDFAVAPKLPIVPVIEGPRKTCLNTYSDYSIQNWPINSEKIEWEISPQQAGSIVTGQFTPNINVQWNNAVYSSVTLKLTSFTCGTPHVYTISINLNNNTLTTSIVPNPVCELALAAFNLTNVTGTPNNIITNWDFGDGYPSTTSSLSASHGFDITPQFGPVFNGNVTTHYDDPSVVGSVNNCMTGIFSVTAIPEPAVYISSDNGLPLCPGPNLLTANPANPATYEWSTGQTTQAISVSSIATYTVTITDVGTGCTNSTNISLTDCNCIADATIPVNPFTDVNTTCGTVEFTATGNTSLYNYIINFGDGTADPITSFGTPTITHQYNSAGYYNVCITATNTLPDPDHCNDRCQQVPVWVLAAFDWSFSCPTVNPNQYTINFNNHSSSINTANYVWKVNGTQFSTATAPVLQWAAGIYVVELTVSDGPHSCVATMNVNVPAIPPQPIFTVSGAPFCEKQTPVQFAYAGADPSLIETALWAFGDPPFGSGSTLFPTTEKIYAAVGSPDYTASLNIIDIFGCSFTSSQNINVNANPLIGIHAATPNPFCPGSTSTISYSNNSGSPSGSSFLWSNSQTTPTISAYETGTFGVTVFDATSGCQLQVIPLIGVATINIPEPKISGKLTLCLGEDLNLNGFAGSGITYSYTVTPAFSIPNTATDPWLYQLNTSGEAPGTYNVTLTITKGSCSRTVTVQVQILAPPPPPVIVPLPSDLCAGIPTTLDVTNNASNAYTVNWSNGMSGNSISVIQANIYQATFTDAAGCTNASSIVINENPSLDWLVSGCYDYCTDDAVIIPGSSAYGFSYDNWKWFVDFNGSGSNAVTGGSGTVTDFDLNSFYGSPLPPGIYVITLFVKDNNGCETYSDPIVVTIRNCPCRINKVTDKLECIGVDANNIAHYNFSFVIDYNFSGPYSSNLQLASTNSCLGISVTSISPGPGINQQTLTGTIAFNISCGADAATCFILTYNDPPDNSCTFPFCISVPECENRNDCEMQIDRLEILCAGKDAAGNQQYTVNVNFNPAPWLPFNVFFSSPQGAVSGFPSTLTAGLSGFYTGMFIDNPPATTPDELFCLQMNAWFVDEGGLYTCFLRACDRLPNCDDGGIGTRNQLPFSQTSPTFVLPQDLFLQPNPATNEVKISYKLATDNGSIYISDLRGKRVFNHNINNQEKGFVLPLNNFNPGIYFVTLLNNNGEQTIKKLIVIK